MSNVVGVLLILLAFVVFVLAVIGFISPKKLQRKNTEFAPKRLHIALVGFFLPIVLFAIGGALIDPPKDASDVASVNPAEAPAPAPAAVVPKKNLGMSPEEFRKAYNNMIGQIDKSWRIAEFEINQGGVNDGINAALGKSVHVVGSIDKSNGKLLGLIVVLGGTQAEENLRAIAALLTVAQVTTQGASKEKISAAVNKLLKDASEKIDDPEASAEKMIVGNRKFTFSASRVTGFMFTVNDANSD